MRERTLTIRSTEGARLLFDEARRGGRRRYRELRLEVPQLSPEENDAWAARLRASYFACGCEEGAVVGGVGLIAFGIWLVIGPSSPETVGWTHAGLGLLAFFVASGLGKALGLARARMRLSSAAAELHHDLTGREVRDPEKPPTEAGTEVLCARR